MNLTELPTKMSPEEACERLNAIPWLITNENIEKVWVNVLWIGGEKEGKILTKTDNRKLAASIIGYMAGEQLRR